MALSGGPTYTKMSSQSGRSRISLITSAENVFQKMIFEQSSAISMLIGV